MLGRWRRQSGWVVGAVMKVALMKVVVAPQFAQWKMMRQRRTLLLLRLRRQIRRCWARLRMELA